MRLPLDLQHRLKTVFPDEEERTIFIVETLENALKITKKNDIPSPSAIGGTLHLFTDGGSRGNPGRAAIGCVLLDPLSGTILKEYGATIGIETNNIAEYKALIEGLKMTRDFQPNTLVCHLDSELVVKQLKGEYKVKMPSFQPLIQEITLLCKEFPSVTFVAIPRMQNRHADRLVNDALDGKR